MRIGEDDDAGARWGSPKAGDHGMREAGAHATERIGSRPCPGCPEYPNWEAQQARSRSEPTRPALVSKTGTRKILVLILG
jgi:hypothetical protein